MKLSRGWIRTGWLVLGASLFSGVTRAEITVLADGKMFLPVLISEQALPEERSAAEELARVLGVMSGLKWPVRSPTKTSEEGIYVGHFPALRPEEPFIVAKDIFKHARGEVGPDAFRVQSSHGSIFIESATSQGIGYAVDWFLDHKGGVRWYAPGAVGEIVPRRARWSVVDLDVLRDPAYVSREISGLNSAEEKVWARRNGLRGRVDFSHSLGRVFSRDALAKHVDWNPLFDGKRRVQTSDVDRNWQPNLALPEVAAYAATVAGRAFAADQKRYSFSLGINDSVRFDQSEATRTLVEPLRYFRGMPDYSPLVFTFMNRAADEVARVTPDRYLGCLAYFWCENTPPFPVHRYVLPFVTTDRSQYYDPKYRVADQALMSRWGASGATAFGLWEYAYGRGFLIPRIPIHVLAESIRDGWNRGARGYFAEVEPHWGFDAFKVWMLARMMWNPELSVEDLENDFYGGYYGAAAGPMRLFFESCENRWMTQSGAPRWLKYYGQEDQAPLFPPEVCEKLRRFLAEAKMVVAKCPVELDRVARTERAFEVTEAFVRFDAMRRALQVIRADNLLAEGALACAIANLEKGRDVFIEKMKAACEEENPAMAAGNLDAFLRNDPVPHLLWLAGLRDSFGPSRILKAAGISKTRSQWWSIAILFDSGHFRMSPNLVENGDFSQPADGLKEPRFLYPKFGTLPAKWKLQAIPTERGYVGLVGNPSDPRQRAVRIEGAYDTQLYQWLPVEAGRLYLAKAEVRGNSSSGNDSALFLTFLDGAGKLLGHGEMQSIPKGVTDDWRLAVLADQAPQGAAWVGVGGGASGQGADDWMEISEIELKAVRMSSM